MFNFSNNSSPQNNITPMFQNWGTSNNNQQQSAPQPFQSFQQPQNNQPANTQGFMSNQNTSFNTSNNNFGSTNQQNPNFGFGFQNNFNTMPQNSWNPFSQNQQNQSVSNGDPIGSAVVSYLFPKTMIDSIQNPANNQNLSIQSSIQFKIYEKVDQVAQQVCQQVMKNKNTQDHEKIWTQVTKSQVKQIDQDLKKFIVDQILSENNIPSQYMKNYYDMKMRNNSLSTLKRSEDRPSIFSSLKSNYKKTQKVQENDKQYNPRFYQTFNQHHFIHRNTQPQKKIDELSFRQVNIKIFSAKQEELKLKQKQKQKTMSLKYDVFTKKLINEICVKEGDLPIPGSYTLKPSLQYISQHSVEELKRFPDLKISNTFGEIAFKQRVSLLRKKIEECVKIGKYEIEIMDEEWQNKDFDVTFYNLGNYQDASKKIEEELDNEQIDDSSFQFQENEKKREKKRKMIIKKQAKNRLEHVKKVYKEKVKDLVKSSDYKLKNFDDQNGNLTIKL